ncbi:MAG: energy-coupling factor transporter transmembrane protein EcfT [Proteobacteria bacterium]|nr:energy-coupling factor transporter transmembrane protein EcfT [Pseudomonadota bacterium]
MVELTVFDYRPGSSFLHRLDIRFKLVILAMMNIVGMQAGPLGLLLLTSGPAVVSFFIRLPFLRALKETRYFIVLLLFVFAARALSTPGDSVIDVWIVSVSRQGIIDGSLICWRLIVVVLLGLMFVFTSRSLEIKAAVEWFLKPFPWLPGKRVATMLGLMVRFLPLILEQAKETGDAQRSRGVENRKNPVFRMVVFVVPLMRRIFESADRLAYAMEARCYSENRTDPELNSRKNDWIIMAMAVGFCLVVVHL